MARRKRTNPIVAVVLFITTAAIQPAVGAVVSKAIDRKWTKQKPGHVRVVRGDAKSSVIETIKGVVLWTKK